MGTTGLLLGAGASYEVGMPLAWELTKVLRDWLTTDKLRSLNLEWQIRGIGHSDSAIENLATVLEKVSMSYEHIIGNLEVHRQRERSQDYHSLISFLSDIVYGILKEQHVLNSSFIEKSITYLDGIKALTKTNKPLWVFSVNHDLIMECFSAYAGIPMRYGFGKETVQLPRRDSNGTVIGTLEAHTLRREQLGEHTINFFCPGEGGINLLKIHGSLDEFAFNDGRDLLKIMPIGNRLVDVITTLEIANNEIRYIDQRWPGGSVKVPNEIVYEDNQGEMQFLRRTLLAGAFKFQNRSSQTIPNELLNRFISNMNQLSELICIGYGFGDYHVNQVIRDWLERSNTRRLKIVDPKIEYVPGAFLHLSPQVEMIKANATDYLDELGEIVRSKTESINRQHASWLRTHRDTAGPVMKEYMRNLHERQIDTVIQWIKTLPWRDGDIDLESLGLTVAEFIELSKEQMLFLSPEEAMEEFLRQTTQSSS